MATVTGLVAASSMLPVNVVTGNEARPSTAARVLWIGGTTRPIFMAEGDIWFRVQSSGPSIPEFVTTILNTMTQGAPFSQALVMNGTPPFTFTIAAGTLPDGLSLHSTTGVISGTPTSSGAYAFTVQADNAVGTSTQDFSGTITNSAIAPDITTTSLNSLTQGSPFSQVLSVIGTNPITWTIAAGNLPSGLTLNSATGTISGTPTGTGAYSFAVQASNTAGSDSQTYSGTIASSGTAPDITTTSLNPMQAGFAFSQTINRTGSTPMTWGISAGSIPTGLSINSSTGVISGTPTTAGPYSFTVSVTNSFGSDTQVYSGTIAASSTPTIYSIFGANTWPLTSYSDAAVGSWFSHQFYSFAGDSPLPAGSKIVGVRLYVPPGSAHIGSFWYAALHRQLTGTYPQVGAFVNDYDTNGSKKLGAALVAGWNEVMFNTEYDIVPAPGSWMVGVQIGDGTRYLHDATYTTGAVKNPQGKNFYLAETSSAIANRSWYGNSNTPANWYGIDVLVKIPS